MGAGYDARMELTPELFEKIEFTERRKGYDTEQVETFLEQAGTALAQMLARVRHTEERAAHAEARLTAAEQKLSQADQVLAEADRRVQQAEQRMQQVASQQAAGAAAASRADEQAEVEQAAKTLLMARRTADATVNEARGQAQTIVEEARSRAERQLQAAEAESDAMLRRATEKAEAEFADRRSVALDEVQQLEGRRAQLTDVINQLEARLAGYRAELARAAQDLLAMVEDPALLGQRSSMSIRADEVLPSDVDGAAGHGPAEPEDHTEPTPELDDAVVQPEEQPPTGPAAGDVAHDAAPSEAAAAAEGVATAPTPSVEDERGQEPQHVESERTQAVEAAALHGQAAAARSDSDGGDDGERTQYLDLTAGSDTPDQVAESDRWGPGSWSDLEPELDEPEESEPHTGRHRDRFMEELDSAVNEAVDLDDDAMRAFFEGGTDSRARRFGWRR